MVTFGVWEKMGKSIEEFSVFDSLVVALVAILLVFLVLTIIILVTTSIQKGMETVEAKTKILPKKENRILDEDPDAALTRHSFVPPVISARCRSIIMMKRKKIIKWLSWKNNS